VDLIQQQIKDQLNNIAGKIGPAAIVPATVLSLNSDTVHIQFSDGSEIEDCRLKSVVKDSNHFFLLPAIGSTVLAGKIENSDEYVVIAVDEITDIIGLVGNVTLSVNKDGFLIKKDNATLKDALKLLIDAVQAIVVLQGTNPNQVKLQQAQDMVNNLLR
jgi:hypothetical protein